MEVGTVALLNHNLQELLSLVEIPTMQHCMGQKDLERLEMKLCYLHLAVPGSMAHLYHIQCDLDQGDVEWAWLSP